MSIHHIEPGEVRAVGEAFRKYGGDLHFTKLQAAEAVAGHSIKDSPQAADMHKERTGKPDMAAAQAAVRNLMQGTQPSSGEQPKAPADLPKHGHGGQTR